LADSSQISRGIKTLQNNFAPTSLTKTSCWEAPLTNASRAKEELQHQPLSQVLCLPPLVQGTGFKDAAGRRGFFALLWTVCWQQGM